MSLKMEDFSLTSKPSLKTMNSVRSSDQIALSTFFKQAHLSEPAHVDPETLPTSDTEEVEYTEKDRHMLDQTEAFLTREKTIKQDYEREMIRLKNNMEKIMKSSLPVQIRIKLMESISELLLTKLNCIRENHKDAKERVLRLERFNNYMTSLTILNNWAKSSNLIASLSDTISLNMNNILSAHVIAEDIAKSDSANFSKGKVSEEMKEEQKTLHKMSSDNVMLEGVIIVLKQAAIPLAISSENLKDDFEDLQGMVMERKRALEEKLRTIEELKRKIAVNDTKGYDKENINPQIMKGENKKGSKLKDIYMDYGEKTQDLSMSKINMSTTNMTVLQEASSKISKVFGSIFKGKKEKVPDKIFTAEVLQDLGIQNSPRVPFSNR